MMSDERGVTKLISILGLIIVGLVAVILFLI